MIARDTGYRRRDFLDARDEAPERVIEIVVKDGAGDRETEQIAEVSMATGGQGAKQEQQRRAGQKQSGHRCGFERRGDEEPTFQSSQLQPSNKRRIVGAAGRSEGRGRALPSPAFTRRRR